MNFHYYVLLQSVFKTINIFSIFDVTSGETTTSFYELIKNKFIIIFDVVWE